MSEPGLTALLLVTLGGLLAASALLSRASARGGIPLALIFLALGMLWGAEGPGGIVFANPRLAFRIGIAALVLILFDGGLNTPLGAIRRGLAPAAVLATVGVAGTAGLAAMAARGLGFAWPQALLLGAIVSSTDAAAVFSVLRGSGLQLRRRVGVTLELESGLNDPMAVVLTIAFTAALAGDDGIGPSLLWEVPLQLAIGGALGVGVGFVARFLLRRFRPPAGGLFPVLTLGLALVAFGLPTLLGGSGFLAVYAAGVVIGNGPLPYRTGVVRVHDAIAWLGQVGMFLLLGLLAVPSRLLDVAVPGLVLALFLAAVARPIAVTACLLPFRYHPREVAYIGWVGLRGAVPIILATYPVLAHGPGASRIFDVVFFVVVANALVPGGTVGRATRWLRQASPAPPPPHAVLEIASTQDLRGEVMSFYVAPVSVVSGSRMSELPFPPGTAAMLIVRGRELIAPRGDTVLSPGDHVYVFSRPEDRPFVLLMFGTPEED